MPLNDFVSDPYIGLAENILKKLSELASADNAITIGIIVCEQLLYLSQVCIYLRLARLITGPYLTHFFQ
jgi:hypothetical protein